MALGGVGGRRVLSTTPEPVQWCVRSETVRNYRSVRGLPMDFADADGGAGDMLVQRPKQLPVGGEIKVYSSRRGAHEPMSSLMSVEEVVKMYESVGAPTEV